MKLVELVAARPVPCAGLVVTITRRCPMSCAHCSSSASMAAGGPDGADLRRFVGSFDPGCRPDILLMTGGEPMLRPDLVTSLARRARAAGCRSAVLTGAFFARRGRLPEPIRTAAEAVDHFSVSIDAFHEREVPRAAAFGLLRRLLDSGVSVSVHAAGQDEADPYLADLVADVRRTFADQVPMLVNTVRPIGRAAGATADGPAASDARPASDREPAVDGPPTVLPCSMAAWPVVSGDGTVVTCGNQATVDARPVPAHLLLGHIATDDWATIRHRVLAAPTLRMIRTTGPRLLWAAGSDDGEPAPGYCQSCRRLGERPGALRYAERTAGGPAGELLDRLAAESQRRSGPITYLRRHACARYADLVDPEHMSAAKR